MDLLNILQQLEDSNLNYYLYAIGYYKQAGRFGTVSALSDSISTGLI